MHYFDNAATTKPYAEVLHTFNKVNENYYFNTASIHQAGRDSAKLLEASRKQVLQLFSLPNYTCVFTSGATESNNIAIQGTLERKKRFGRTILVSQIEHPSVINIVDHYGGEGFNVEFIRTTGEGRVDVGHLESLLNEDVVLVAVMAVNNIVGSVQPVEEIKDALMNYPKVHFHVDATQAVGKAAIDYRGVDSLSISAHKFHGVKGAGALMLKEGKSSGQIHFGGGHEYDIRSGTVNLPAVAAMAKALRLTLEDMDDDLARIEGYNHSLRSELDGLESIVIQPSDVPHIINLSFTGAKGEVVVNALSEKNVMVSTTSACASKRAASNETLTAMNRSPEVIDGSIRISMSRETETENVEVLISALKEVYEEIGDVLR
ncbi:cysteine desulfurase family protein [Lacicoccus alkaliphilus]|uniref:Cysteine desulfurase n=1 Tax=Lacicoccus alkaliphilus DSM 16010 TaxID=1123231 RepID=A0A1M7AKM6_9BACL|nr:cysteine desulfurase family protein [Salinicoccus alkaliphilus]SHL43288.1 cysteine desulfurase [Salinicoccus alkaliphilus DSM 16010]